MKYKTIRAFAEDSGYSEKAIQEKISKGVWRQGKEYRRAPDNRILIDIQGVEKWVDRGQG